MSGGVTGTHVAGETGFVSDANARDNAILALQANAASNTETVYSGGNSGTTKTLVLANGTQQAFTMTGNCTFTMPTVVAGKSFMLHLTQDATGGRTATFTSVKWPGGAAPTLTSAATSLDLFSFVSNVAGTAWLGLPAGYDVR